MVWIIIDEDRLSYAIELILYVEGDWISCDMNTCILSWGWSNE